MIPRKHNARGITTHICSNALWHLLDIGIDFLDVVLRLVVNNVPYFTEVCHKYESKQVRVNINLTAKISRIYCIARALYFARAESKPLRLVVTYTLCSFGLKDWVNQSARAEDEM